MSKAQSRRTLDKLHVINDDGSRRKVYPADVTGRFTRLKPWLYGALMLFYAGLPWLSVGGNPAVWFDIPRRRAFLFGAVFNAQDFYLATSLLTGVGFALIVTSALFGRVWCGWGCPQTVFLEGVFRRLERLIEGPSQQRIALASAPWTGKKLVRRVALHAIYLVAAWTITHLFLSYFVSARGLLEMIVDGPRAHPTAFLWGLVPTAALYFNFCWFREQLCLIVCPYGRLQSALQDRDTIIIGYDEKRGEPRGKAHDVGAADCVDCGRCVVVCPTDIDIRNGLQMECLGCAACVDACDEIMVKLGRPTGLIRYDSQRGLSEGVRRFWRPRVGGYVVAGAAGLGFALFLFLGRTSLEANVLRPSGVPYVLTDGVLRNQFVLHVVNKNAGESTLRLSAQAPEGIDVMIPQPSVTLDALQDHTLPVMVTLPASRFQPGLELALVIDDGASGQKKRLSVKVLGPHGSKGARR